MTGRMISVVVPVYNASKYLRQCIESIIGQTYKDIEVLLVDDGSADDSVSICVEYARKDFRIKVIQNKHSGAMAARKTGALQAGGEYLTFADSDDWLDENMYEEMVSFINRLRADIVCTGYLDEADGFHNEVHPNFDEGLYEGQKLESIYPKILYMPEINWFGISANCWDKLFKRDVIIDYLLATDERLRDGDDHAFVYPALLKAKSIYINHKPLYHHRRHEAGSLSSPVDDDVFERFGYLYSDMKARLQGGEYWEPVEDSFNRQMRWFLVKYINRKLGLELFERHVAQPPYIFPFGKVERDAKVILYGAGKVGKAYHDQIRATEYCDVQAWADRNAAYGSDYITPDHINDNEYDCIVIAVASPAAADQIIEELCAKGVDKKRIIWSDPYVYQ